MTEPGGVAISRRVVMVVSLAFAAGIALLFSPAVDWLRGYALYHGRIAIPGRIAGQSFDLPRVAVRCAGCHEGRARELAQDGQFSLDLNELAKPRTRRGGPPIAYTAESFCAVLRSGLDPTGIVLSRVMPRFAGRDEDCRALWAYLGGP